MPEFSKRSLERLKTCDTRLQDVANAAIKRIAFQITCGHRGQAEQDLAFAQGNSKLKWPKSKHNASPSLAFDFIPEPLDWHDIESFRAVGTVLKEEAAKMNIAVEHGGDWIKFKDWPHFQLV